MNCKPNELAIVVSAPGPRTAPMIGKIVRVTTMVIDGGDACWEFEGPPLRLRIGGRAIELIEDEFLRPIRPDGVSEEEVGELYAPQPAEVTS